MQENNLTKKKITLSLDEQTLDLLEEFVKNNYLNSKSQAIRVLVNKDADNNRNNRDK